MQITPDGLSAYREAVGDAFGEVDFAQLHKVYGLDPKVRGAQRRYSPPMVTSTQVTVVSGDPNPGVSLHYMHYNFGRVHQTLRCTPAQAAGVADKRWTLADIAGLLD